VNTSNNGRSAEGASSGATSSGSATSSGNDWVGQFVGTVESTVGKVRAATTDRVVNTVRLVLFALMGFGVAIVMMLLLTIGSVRFLVNMLPFRNDAWAAYTIVGALLVLVGSFLWRKRD
jgi:hypothetical protein